MVLAAILWVCALPQTDDLGKFSAALKANGERQTLSVTPFDSTSRDSIVRAASPSAPELKVKAEAEPAALGLSAEPVQPVRDRKSTRLNSSHGYISYAVFCLKKKKFDEARHCRRLLDTA